MHLGTVGHFLVIDLGNIDHSYERVRNTCTNTNANILCKVNVVLMNLISSGGAAPVHSAVDAAGSYLAVANYFGGSISVFSTFVGAQVC